MQKSQGNFESNYKAIGEKTAIISDSYNIDVQEKTSLEAADIRSLRASNFSTNSLTVSDVENKAEFSAQHSSVGISCGMSLQGTERFALNAAQPFVASLANDKSSNTKSHISNATSTVQLKTKQPNLTQLLSELAESSDQGPLENDFNQEKIMEQIELASSFNQNLNKFVSKRVESIDRLEQKAEYLEERIDEAGDTLNQEDRLALLGKVEDLKRLADKGKRLWGAGGIARQACLAVGAAAGSTSSLGEFALYSSTHLAQQKLAQGIGNMVSEGVLEEGHPYHVGIHAITAYGCAALRGENCTSAAIGAAVSTLIPAFFQKPKPQMLETVSFSL